jgi:hypothetical protein
MIKPKPRVTFDQVKAKMDSATDWFRIDDNWWIIFTTGTAKTWQAKLKPLVDPSGLLFICKLDMSERSGWMKKDFWEWIRVCQAKRSVQS